MHDAEGRIIAANASTLARGRVAVIGFGPPAPASLAAVPGCTAITSFNTDLRAHRALRDDAGAVFGSWLSLDDPADVAVVRLPKERDRLRMWLAMARASLAPGGTIAVAGRNDSGVKGAARQIEEVGTPVVLDTRAHCRLYVVDGVDPAPASPDDWRMTWEAAGLTVAGYPGVFAAGALDDGTAMLLDALPDPAGSTALDVGCGSGVIAAWLAARGATVTAADSDALAVRATRDTLAANGLTGEVTASDVYDDVAGSFDLVVSNPPFHAGVKTTTTIARRILTEAPIARGGQLIVVGNRHLEHDRVLRERYAAVEILAEDARYRVWRARSPR